MPITRSGCLAKAVAHKIYYFGGRGSNNEEIDEMSLAVIHIFDTETYLWEQVNVEAPRNNCGEIFLYASVIGTDIWVMDEKWVYCFDTLVKNWKKLDEKVTKIGMWKGNINPNEIAVVEGKMYIYNSNCNSIDNEMWCVDTSEEVIVAMGEAIGDVPGRRDEVFLYGINEDLIVLFAPCDEGEVEERGEVFYFSVKENKWARENKREGYLDHNCNSCVSCGRIGAFLVFVGEQSWDEKSFNSIYVHDLMKMNWSRIIVEGNAPEHMSHTATLVGNKIYCWMENGDMNVIEIDVEEKLQNDESLIAKGKELLSKIKVFIMIN